MEATRWQDAPANRPLYDAEVGLLKNGLDGSFELKELVSPDPDGRITAIGFLSYGENGKKEAIKIVFPTKYPYRQPSLIALATDQLGNILQQPKLFGKGNQYGNGALCLMLDSQWDMSQHNIGSHLRRAQRWLVRATSTEGFPADEIVEELPAHLPHIGQVIMGKTLDVPLGANNGTIVLTQFKPNHYILEDNVLPASPFTLTLGKEAFNWYAFPQGVTLKSVFSSGNPQQLLDALKGTFGIEPQKVLAQPNIALYLPSERNPWHFFKLNVVQQMQGGGYLPGYLIARAMDKELYHRTKDIFDSEILAQKRVTIVGLGAIGSEAARSLARNGIGHFDLFDKDTFEVGNSVRHAADLFYIGEQKTSVVRQLILRSNPTITVNEYPNIDVLDDTGHLERCLSNCDLCLVLTAEDSVDYFINDYCLSQFDIPFVFARVSAGGQSGSLQVVQHGVTACLRCLAKGGLDTLPSSLNDREYKELAPEYGSCSMPAMPGSEIDTKEIALQVSRVSLQLLLGGNSRYPRRLADQYYWHGPAGSKENVPFHWETANHSKHPDCELCNP